MNPLIQMSISGSFMIVFILCFRRFASAYIPKRIIIFLWLFVIVRLLVPFSIPVRWQIECLAGFSAGQSYSDTALSSSGAFPPFSHTMENALLPSSEHLNSAGFTEILPTRGVSWLTVLWFAAALFFAVLILINHLLCLRRYRGALPFYNAAAENWIAAHQTVRRIRLRQSDRTAGPLTYGLIKPVILLPAELALTDSELLLILEHEWNHIRRWDILLKYMMYFALCIYWFNPFVWMMAILMNRDLELACDEEVVRSHSGKWRETYALLLILMAEKQTERRLAGMYFTRYSETEERIRSIMTVKKYTKKTVIIVAAAFLCMAPAFTSMADAQNRETGQIRSTSRAMTQSVSIPGSSDTVPHRLVTGDQIADLAVQYIGNPYLYGGTDLLTGVDSSGFVQAIYGKAGITLPRSVSEQAREGRAVKADNIAAGDLIFYGKNDGSFTVSPVHVGIYIGDGHVIHASNAREGVKISDAGYRDISFIVRVLD